MERRVSFDIAAKTYDDARPSYPGEVIDWIINKTNISPNMELLEIGAGTGQATIKFAERGYKVRCIEMGKNLADILMNKTRHLNVSVDVSSFETWKPQNPYKTPFIFSATAFHWIDTTVKYRKCHDLLVDDGFLVLLWNVASDTEIPEVREAYNLLWSYYPERKTDSSFDIKNEGKQEIINSGFFTLEDYTDYKWKFKQSKESFVNGFFSQSSFLSLDEKNRSALAINVRELLKSLDDIMETEFNTIVYIAKKKSL